MSKITVYTTEPCPYCAQVKGLLRARGLEFTEINLSKDPEGRAELARKTGMMTFPQVLVDGRLVGGFKETQAPPRAAAWTSCSRRSAHPGDVTPPEVAPHRLTAAQVARRDRPPDCRGRLARRGRSRTARARLAGLADVGPASGGDHLDDRAPARRAGLAGAAVDEEAVLEGAAEAVDVAEVVDRGPARVDPFEQRRDDGVAQALVLLEREPPGGPQRVDAGAEEGLVGVDVADARDAALVEQEGLDRGAAPAGERRAGARP